MALTTSRLDHLVGRPTCPVPDHDGTRSEMSAHSSSVKSPCVVRQVVAMDTSVSATSRVYGLRAPAGGQNRQPNGIILTTASKTFRKRLIESSLPVGEPRPRARPTATRPPRPGKL